MLIINNLNRVIIDKSPIQLLMITNLIKDDST